MKISQLIAIVFLAALQQSFAQQSTDNKKQILNILDIYSESVIKRDSIAFYSLFNDGTVTWCAAVKDRSQSKRNQAKGTYPAESNYFSSSYKGFLRSLFRHQSTEDKFDAVKIIEDGTVASVTMDYSFWADRKMTNWGCKYLSLIKKDGKWKITSVIYSLELTEYFEQPTLKERQKLKN